MRHSVLDKKFGRSSSHRKAMVSALVCGLIKDNVAPKFVGRNGGYTRIVLAGNRVGDGAEMAYLEWVDGDAVVSESPATEVEAKA